MQERRQIHRWHVMREACFQIDGDERTVACSVRDINFKGMQISLSERLPGKTSLRMNFIIDQVLNLDVEAAVPWSLKEGGRHIYGLSFRQIADDEKAKIYEYVSTHFPHQLKEQWWGHV